MVRKLALAVSLAVGTLPFSAYALGLGEIKTSSALNERFVAEIPLLSVKQGELDRLKVTLAPADVFARAGVERPYHLTGLKFKPLRTKDGRVVIKVTSNKPIREPYLDFLVQVTWPQGQLVKEYTVLLDPPVLTQRRAPRVEAPRASRTAQASRYAKAVPGGEYGPVRRNETLWVIADRLRPAGVSIHQMMVALYKANPQAFLRNDINLLKKGQILRIPNEEALRALNKRQAVAEFARLSKAKQVAQARPKERASTETATTASARQEQDRLTLASAKDNALDGAQGNAEAEALRQKLMLVEEEAAVARQEAENLRQRMDELESKLEQMAKALAVKDQELARLQAQAKPAEEEMDLEVPLEEPIVEEEPQGAAEQAAEPAEAPSLPEAQVTQEQPPAAPPAKPQQPKPARVAPPEPQPEPSPGEVAMNWLTDNWQLAAAGGGAVLLGLVGLGLARRRKTQDEEVPPSATVIGEGEDDGPESLLQDDATVMQPNAESTMGGDTSFLSEYSSEELRALNEDTVEVDPVSEADVYIAYGRYSQAEEILNEAMENGDQSAEVRHKMLEVYYATQKKDQFRKLVEQMQADGQDKEDPKAWEHILTMGRDLDSANPLYAGAPGGQGAGVASAAAAAGMASAAAGITSEMGEGDSEFVDEDSSLSLDLSTLADELDSTLTSETETEQPESLSSLDLDLPSLHVNDEEGHEEAHGDANSGADALGDLELNETELHTEMADVGELEGLGGVESNMLDESLMKLTDDLEGVMADSRVLDEPFALDEGRVSALDDLSTQLPGSELGEGDSEQQSPADSDSRIGDEVETKLELARAFIEIGDADGARSILNEVQEDGTAAQKEEAAKLLAQLS